MFDENFSFGSRSGSLDSSSSSTATEPSRAVSPCSAITAFPPPSYTVTDLAASFGRSRLRQDAQICYDSCDSYANHDDDAGWQLDPIPTTETEDMVRSVSRATPSRSHSPTRRIQRQSSSRLLCTTAHHRDIAALVARMVTHQDQCSVASAASLCTSSLASAAAAADEDEGYDSSECFPDSSSARSRRGSMLAPPRAARQLQYRRSSEFKTTGACVNKAIRLRKDKVHKRKADA